VILVCVSMALAFSSFSERSYAADTLLGVMAHSALAIGLVSVSFISGVRFDLSALLFGDILAVSSADVAMIWGGAIVTSVILYLRWSRLLIATLNPDLARASGISPKFEERIFAIALAIVVAASIKIVGALLITSMLIIPAAAARPWARTPEQMALVATAAAKPIRQQVRQWYAPQQGCFY